MEVDAGLQEQGVDIPARPIQALREIGLRLTIALPIAGSQNIPGPATENWGITDRVYRWYEQVYGDALKVDPCIGRFLTSLSGDLWIVRIPLVFGRMTFYTSATLPSDRQGGRCNIADLIVGFTPALRLALTSEQEAELTTQFVVALEGVQWLTQTRPDSLFRLALGNIEASVESATRRRHDYGLSKWESLQATEKVIKAAIRSVGGQASTTHKLTNLLREAASLGMLFDIDKQVAAIQCSAGIRYGDEPCDKIQALRAHQAMLQAIWIIRAELEPNATG